jgi:hypothetical protein
MLPKLYPTAKYIPSLAEERKKNDLVQIKVFLFVII